MIPPVDLIGVGERHEQPHRQAALVIFEQVHITRTDAERRGHLSLCLLALAPQLPKLRADEGLCHGGLPEFTTQQDIGTCMQTRNT